MRTLAFDVAHLLAGSVLVLSFVLLYQGRITAVLNVFAWQAVAPERTVVKTAARARDSVRLIENPCGWRREITDSRRDADELRQAVEEGGESRYFPGVAGGLAEWLLHQS